MNHLDWTLLALGLLVVALAWWFSWRCGREIEPAHPKPQPHCASWGHTLKLHPDSLDRLSCMFCPLDMDLPRGAPESLVERLRWARDLGLLMHQQGRSVSFIEALRGTE